MTRTALPYSAPDLSALARLLERALLDHQVTHGRLEHWPPKLSVQRLVMWVLWTRFDARRVYTEAEVNKILKGWHTYGDHVTLRRELINHRLMTRKSDCSEYRKLALEPGDEARALLQALRASARTRTRRRTQRPPHELPRAAQAAPAA